MTTSLKCIFKFASVAFIVLLTISYANSAVPPAVKITPKPEWVISPVQKYIKSSLRQINNGYLYALLEEQTHIEKKAVYTHVVREIVSEAGIQNGSNISLNFDPAYEKVEFHKLTVWRDNKPLNRLNKKVFKIVANEPDLERFLYHGSYTALLVLDDIRKGDRIEYSYTITGFNPIFNNKFSSELYMQGYDPVMHLYVSLISSKSRNLHIKTFNSTKAPKISEYNGFKKYEWESFNVPAVLYEDYQPEWFNNLARVQVSEYNDWGEVVGWAMQVNPIPDQLKGKLWKRVEQLKKESGGQKEIFFREAVRVVQDEIRYMGVEMGEYSHRANSPEKVYNQRYGDCKDKSLLLASMLQAGGIPARLALINTVYKDEVFHHLPSPLAFNHMVVVATIYNQDVWVDPTISYQGGRGIDIAFPEYKAALILQRGYHRLINPVTSVKGGTICNERYIVPNENSEVQLNVETIYTGQKADVVRARLANTSMNKVSSANLDYYSKIYPQIRALDSIKVDDDRANNTLTINEKYLISDFFQSDSATKRYNVNFYANFIKEQLPSIAFNRKNPIALNYPCDIDYTIEVVLNSGWNIKPENFSIERDSYKFSRKVWASYQTLFINYQFTYLKDYVTAESAATFAKDIRQISDTSLSYSVSYYPGMKENNIVQTNYPIVCFAIIMLTILVLFAIKIYRKETLPSDVYLDGYGRQVGGWLILVTIALLLTPFRVGIFLLNQGYFTTNLWELVPATGNTFMFKVGVLFELIFNLFTFCAALFCVFLLLKRRDIFPKFIIGFYIVNVCGVLLDSVLSSYFFANSEGFGKEAITSIIAAAIWIPYFLRSSRVQETFIVPYPAYNYDGEEPVCEHEEKNENKV